MISYNRICCLDQTTILIHYFSMNTPTNPSLPKKKKKIPSVRNHRPGLDHGLNYDKNGPQMVGSKRKINRQLDFWYNLFKPEKKKKLFLLPQIETSNGNTIQEQTNVFSFSFFLFFFSKELFLFLFFACEREVTTV